MLSSHSHAILFEIAFLLDVPRLTLHVFLLSPARAKRLPRPNIIDLIIQIVCEEYSSWSFIVMQFCLNSCTALPFKSKYNPKQLLLEQPHTVFFPPCYVSRISGRLQTEL
jgi:hypothetical protein